MSNRYFVDGALSRWDDSGVWLTGGEAHHFSNVMRGKIGDPLIVFDGTGRYARGVVENIQREEIRIRVTDIFADEVESPLRLTVCTALPKGDRQRFLIEKLTELGVARFIPVRMERSVARANDAVIQRFRRYVIESAKQCERNVLMEITDEIPISKLNEVLSMEKAIKYLLHPVSLGSVGQTTPKQIVTDLPLPDKAAILVGPEGSFTDREVSAMLQEGFRPLDLGKRILRTETACLGAAALFLTVAG